MIRPLQDKVVLEIRKEEEVTKGGIILANNSNVKSQTARVIAVGPGDVNNGIRTIMEVRENDIVLIEKGIGTEIEYEGNPYVVVSQKEILAVIK